MEKLVLACIGIGQTNGEIAEELGCCALTVQTHRQNLMHKLAVHCSAELKRFAWQFGLVQFSRGTVVRPGFEQTFAMRKRACRVWRATHEEP
jgi:DNA-binding CsgD family transcriptional regulator